MINVKRRLKVLQCLWTPYPKYISPDQRT